jgi:hypothetical protein
MNLGKKKKKGSTKLAFIGGVSPAEFGQTSRFGASPDSRIGLTASHGRCDRHGIFEVGFDNNPATHFSKKILFKMNSPSFFLLFKAKLFFPRIKVSACS